MLLFVMSHWGLKIEHCFCISIISLSIHINIHFSLSFPLSLSCPTHNPWAACPLFLMLYWKHLKIKEILLLIYIGYNIHFLCSPRQFFINEAQPRQAYPDHRSWVDTPALNYICLLIPQEDTKLLAGQCFWFIFMSEILKSA